jgi:hypothetical protein
MSKTESTSIGAGRCPCCGSLKARFTVSKSQLAVVTCNACNFQGFSRSDRSDELLRAAIQAAPVAPVEAQPAQATPPAPDTKKPGMAWGMLRA